MVTIVNFVYTICLDWINFALTLLYRGFNEYRCTEEDILFFLV